MTGRFGPSRRAVMASGAALAPLGGCGAPGPGRLAAPPGARRSFVPPGMSAHMRAYSDGGEETVILAQDLRGALARRARPRLDVLTLSGGGPGGAYGAGVLVGWNTAGRPEFDVVTGVSTGALMAPLAFLGPAYDDRLRRLYTRTDTRALMRYRIVGALLFDGPLARNEALRDAIARELDDDLLRAVGAEHRRGRRLYVGTTDIDAERPVIWNLGAIAAAGRPEGFALIRDVVLASAAIPVLFPPVRIAVTDGTIVSEELHVDGALTAHVFAYPHDLPMRAILVEAGLGDGRATIWVLHNKRLEPRFQAQDERLSAISTRALRTLTRAQGLGDLATIRALAGRDGLEVRTLAIPRGFEHQRDEFFDPAYMDALFDVGLRDGADPAAWTGVSDLGSRHP